MRCHTTHQNSRHAESHLAKVQQHTAKTAFFFTGAPKARVDVSLFFFFKDENVRDNNNARESRPMMRGAHFFGV